MDIDSTGTIHYKLGSEGIATADSIIKLNRFQRWILTKLLKLNPTFVYQNYSVHIAPNNGTLILEPFMKAYKSK